MGSPDRPSFRSEVPPLRGKRFLLVAGPAAAVLAIMVACGSTEETPQPTAKSSVTPALGVDPLTNCSPGTELVEPGQGEKHWPDLLGVSFLGEDVPKELETLIEKEGLCFFTYVPADEQDSYHLLWLPDPQKLEEVKSILDELVASGIISSVDLEPVADINKVAPTTR